MKKVLLVLAVLVVLVAVGFGVSSWKKSENTREFYEKKDEVLSLVESDPVEQALNVAYGEVIDVAKETELPIQESFLEVKENTIDIHVLTTLGQYKVVSVEKPSTKEVLSKVTNGAKDMILGVLKGKGILQ